MRWRRRASLFLSRLLVRALSFLLPGRVRRDWEREWRAELAWRARRDRGNRPPRPVGTTDRPHDGAEGHALLRPAAGAVADTVHLAIHERRPDMLFQDLRYALRTLARRPAFTTVAVLTLAVGIGANTAIFTLMDRIVLEPLPFEQPGELVRIWGTNSVWGSESSNVNPLDVRDWRASATTLEGIAAVATDDVTLTGEGDPLRLEVGEADVRLLDVLGVEPLLGRGFRLEEEEPGKHRVVLLSHGFWERRFAADPEVVGTRVVLEGVPHTVIGVLGPEFRHPIRPPGAEMPELWLPLAFEWNELGRGGHFLQAVGRLGDGTSRREAQREMDRITAELEATYPGSNTGWGVRLVDLHDDVVGAAEPALVMLMGAVAFVLLIACANVANLLLARGMTRHQEIAVRRALGASRGRLVQQLLTEAGLLSIGGGILGVALAVVGLQTLAGGAFRPGQTPGLDAGILAFTLAVSLATGLAFGLLPALRLSQPGVGSRTGGVGAGDARDRRLRDGLLVAEIGLSMVLLVGAGLMVRSLWTLMQVDPGVDTDSVLTFRVSPPPGRYDSRSTLADFHRRLGRALAGMPGVESHGAVNILPFGGSYSCDSFGLGDRPVPAPGQEPCAESRWATPGYFETLGIELLRARPLTDSDDAESPPVVVVNRAMAEEFWPGDDPVRAALGKEVREGSARSEGPWYRIVGVVEDVRHFGLRESPEPEIYWPQARVGGDSMSYVVRSSGPPEALVGPIRAAVLEIDEELPIYDVAPMGELVAASAAADRFGTVLLATFAGIALLLALVGLYCVMAYAVVRRHREIGVRLALGARHRDVVGRVVGRGVALAGAGVALGLAGSLALGRALAGLLYRVSPTDPVTLVAAAALLLGVATLASWIPARRASRIDPVVTLRSE